MTSTDAYLAYQLLERKILAKILFNRLNVHLDQAALIPENMCGFKKDRGTINMILTAIELQEQNVDLYMTFVDLTKPFDTVRV